MDQNIYYKLILLGDSGVGKTSLLYNLTERSISNPELTIGVDFFSKIVECKNGQEVKLNIWDTAGQEKFNSIIKVYYRNIHLAIIMYDVTNKKSFESVRKWLNELKKEVVIDIPIMLVGNKIDQLQLRQISYNEGIEFSNKHNLLYYETSINNVNLILNLFKIAAETLIEKDALLTNSLNLLTVPKLRNTMSIRDNSYNQHINCCY